jgi:hypothetical protein
LSKSDKFNKGTAWTQMETMCLSKEKPRKKVRMGIATMTMTMIMVMRNPQAGRSKTAISMLVLSKSIMNFDFLMVINLIFSRHCVGGGESEGSHASCGLQTRDYDIPLRIGTLFAVLATSAIGVFAPILLMKLPFASINGIVSTVIKQFGTGIILSTAFVHVCGPSSYTSPC